MYLNVEKNKNKLIDFFIYPTTDGISGTNASKKILDK